MEVFNNSLQNLRTEIVLCDANDVAFWVIFSIKFATFWQSELGKHRLSTTHQMAKPKALFPVRVSTVSKIFSGGGINQQ
jgi:hypothetical protein